ncbi:MAG: hypothetical protein ACRDXX_12740, partial [Stackebrandtia sp.]
MSDQDHGLEESPRRGRVIVVGIVALTAVTVIAAVVMAVVTGLDYGSRSERQTQTYDQDIEEISIDASGGVKVKADPSAEEVVVERSLEWTRDKPGSDERWDGASLTVADDCVGSDAFFGWTVCKVDYTVTL